MDEQLEKYFNGDLNAFERSALLKAIASDPDKKKLYTEYKNMSGLLSIADKVGDREESRSAYIRFLGQNNKRKVRNLVTKYMKYAVVCTLLITTTYLITNKMGNRTKNSALTNTLYVPAGQRVKITLQDGTEVWLNSQTTMTYPAVFNDKERKVRIEGEAFFDVAKDAERPFIVSARNLNMKALGTQFNVYNYPNEPFVRTSLLEGGLKIYFSHSENDFTILSPNEELTVEADRMTKGEIPYSDYFLWKDGIYSFHDELLVNILKKLELYYEVKFVIEDTSIHKWEYTGKFRQRDGIDEILRMICKIHKFKVEKNEENNIITLK